MNRGYVTGCHTVRLSFVYSVYSPYTIVHTQYSPCTCMQAQMQALPSLQAWSLDHCVNLVSANYRTASMSGSGTFSCGAHVRMCACACACARGRGRGEWEWDPRAGRADTDARRAWRAGAGDPALLCCAGHVLGSYYNPRPARQNKSDTNAS